MSWLSPLTGLLAAAVAVPLLLLLYFLKLRRPEQLVSSTLLWRRAVRDLQVNAPFQRLRRNLLLLLQLLAIACILLALAGPVLRWDTQAARRYAILIDRSASMNASDGGDGRSRLDEAKRQARQVVESLRGPAAFDLGGDGDQATVIAFHRNAKVMCTFTSDRRQLLDAIDAIEPTDGTSSLGEAMTLARAFAESPGTEANDRSAEKPAQLDLFSDGRIVDLDQLVVSTGELNFHAVGKSTDNIAIVTMQARRSYERPEQVEVFAALANHGPDEVTCDVQMSLDDQVRAVRSVQIPPRRPPSGTEPARPGQVSVTFSLVHGGSGVIQVSQLRPDILAADDAAWAVLPPPKKLSALLVTAGNATLANVLRACPLADLAVVSPAQFDAMDHVALGAQQRYDLIVLDNHPAARHPVGRYIVLGSPPPSLGLDARPRTDARTIVDWQSQHPVLQHVNFENLVALRSWQLALPREANVLAKFADGPAIGLLHRQGSAFLLVGLDVLESNWPFEPSFVLFWYNAAQFIGSELSQEEQTALKVGSAIAVRSPAGAGPAGPARLTGPNGLTADLPADPSGVYRFAGTTRAGLYTVTPPGSAPSQFAVNLLDSQESDIEPAGQVVLSGQVIAAQAGPGRTNLYLWPWLVLAAVILVCLEWLVYSTRVRLR